MDTWKPSVTVAAVIEDRERFLLVQEQTVAGVRLNQPAGHLEPGESLLEAVRREALEETGHHVRVLHGIGVYLARFVHEASMTDVTYLRFAFACRVVAHEPLRALDEGIVRTHWLTAAQLRDRAAEHRSALVMQVVDDFLTGQRFDAAVLKHVPDFHARASGGGNAGLGAAVDAQAAAAGSSLGEATALQGVTLWSTHRDPQA
jgi:phosphatase NudJ